MTGQISGPARAGYLTGSGGHRLEQP